MSDVTRWPTFPWMGDISTKVPAEFGSTDPSRPGDRGGTRKVLEALLRSLGFEKVTVVSEQPPAT